MGSGSWSVFTCTRPVFSIALFTLEAIFKTGNITQWIWHLFSVALVVFSLQQKELKPLRLTIVAFIPYVIISIFADLTNASNRLFFKQWEDYFDYALMFAYVWMGVVFFTQNRQVKAAEKERIKRQHEDDLNRAIAIRKVELEGLVVERTAELTKQKEALEQTLTELQATQKQLIQSEKMASLGELTAGIAHEIQNPLNFVNNFSEVNSELIAEMKEELLKGNIEEAKQIADDINDNEQKIIFHGKRADGIVKGMLQHSRSSTGVKEPVNINTLADEYLRLAYHGLRAKDKSFNATMKTEYDENIGNINIIPQDIGRVILNLITNAFYAVTEKKKAAVAPSEKPYEPTVTVSTKKAGNKVEIKVSDNGNGIPQKVLDKIFQPFFTTKPTGQGTGLGLSMSYDIVTKGHGGELKVENKEGEGATFIIILPV
ncbi:MAG: histidine kinase [Chitinophagaceae bacterium]|nr:histidine kinase [Chitinophagaceae bacterium]